MGVCRRASPRLRNGPMAASLARAVISEPEKPIFLSLGLGKSCLRYVEVVWVVCIDGRGYDQV